MMIFVVAFASINAILINISLSQCAFFDCANTTWKHYVKSDGFMRLLNSYIFLIVMLIC